MFQPALLLVYEDGRVTDRQRERKRERERESEKWRQKHIFSKNFMELQFRFL